MIPRFVMKVTIEWTEKGPADSWLSVRQFTGARMLRVIEVADVALYGLTVIACLLWVVA